MTRMSRRFIVVLAILMAMAMNAFFAYMGYLNHRLSSEILNSPWRNPTIITSNATGFRDTEIVRVYGADWRASRPVSMKFLPPHVANAFIAAEDIRFRKHLGVDPIGMGRALFANVRSGGIAQGGSTIDQQLIKSRFFSNERTYRRKIVEVLLAVVLDARMSKDDILEGYLNDVYLGHVNGRALLGIDEASRVFFNKPAENLSVAEAALIAGIVRAPNRDTPDKRPNHARARRNAILNEMRERQWISEGDYQRAVRRSVDLRPGLLPDEPFPYYLSALRKEVVEAVGDKPLLRGGLRVVCEMDPNKQRAAERAVRSGVRSLVSRYPWIREQSRREPLQAALLSVDPLTGGIRALIGGADFARTTFDRTRSMRRQPGSAFKTFAFASAIVSREATNATLLMDTPVRIELASNETWEPRNYDGRFRGRVTVREAFEKSLNVPAVRLAQEVGITRVIDMAGKFGFTEEFPEIPALPLGVTEVSMRELTGAYTVFPGAGQRVTPYLLREVLSQGNQSLYRHNVKRDRVLDEASAYVVHSLLRGVVRRGTASRLKRYGLGFVAGKTGTTNDYRDAWFAGYSSDLVTTVWVGFDRGAPLRLSSAEAALPTWALYMRDAALNHKDIERPSGVVERQIDPESGFLWAEGCPGPVQEVFLAGTAPTHRCPRGAAGRFLRKVLFDDESFDEPSAITFEQFRKLANDVDRGRQRVENTLERISRFFGSGDREKKEKKGGERKKGRGRRSGGKNGE